MSTKTPCIYILTNKRNGTLYTGVTSDPVRRIWEHKQNSSEGFTKKYRIHRLVYYEFVDDMYVAISREKQIKAGSRKRKLTLIESMNPEWKDLYPEICG